MMLNLLCIEDDIRYFENIRSGLHGFANFKHAKNIEDAYSIVESHFFDALIIDLNVSTPNDGLVLAEEFILKNIAPVIFLTSDNSMNAKISCLKIGVSDYLWKTMELEEIKLRITNAVRNHKKNDTSQSLELENLKLVPGQSKVIIDNCRLEISALELRFLDCVIRHYPQTVDRNLLILTVWSAPAVTAGAVSTAIYQLNKKLANWKLRIASSKGKEIGLVHNQDILLS